VALGTALPIEVGDMLALEASLPGLVAVGATGPPDVAALLGTEEPDCCWASAVLPADRSKAMERVLRICMIEYYST